MKKTITFFVLILLLSKIGTAQEKKQALNQNELDKEYTPPKSALFGEKEKGNFSQIKNSIKFYPCLIVRNIFALYYERAINDQITFQGGLGFCGGVDIIQMAGATMFDEFDNDKSSLNLSQILQKAEPTSALDLYSSLSVKIYFNSYYETEAFDGSYIELNGRFYSNSFTLSDNNSSDSYYKVGGIPTVTVGSANYNLIYGHQFFTEGKIKTTHDFYMGFGLRSSSYDQFQRVEEEVADQYGYKTTQNVNYKMGTRVRAIMPTLLFGYAFGFGF